MKGQITRHDWVFVGKSTTRSYCPWCRCTKKVRTRSIVTEYYPDDGGIFIDEPKCITRTINAPVVTDGKKV